MQIVTRAEWGAEPAEGTPVTWNPDSLLGVTVHWFGIPSGASDHSNCAGLVRAVQRAHKAGEFNDIAYNHLFCSHGVAFEGRGFGRRTGANGTTEANSNYAAICWMGGSGDTFVEKAQDAGAFLLSEWFKRGVNRVVVPHRKWTGTACPGAATDWVVNGGWRADLPQATRVKFELWDDGKKVDESLVSPIAESRERFQTFLNRVDGQIHQRLAAEGSSGDVRIVRRVLS